MATMKTISAALKLVDSKKENLRKAFEDLQSHSSSLPSFNINWSDLDSYITSTKSSLEHKFNLLQSQQQKPKSQSHQKKKPQSQSQQEEPQLQSQQDKPQSQLKQKPNSQLLEQTQIEPSSRNQSEPDPGSESVPEPPNQSNPEAESASAWVPVPARPELKSFCEKTDGLGLRNYVFERIKEWKTIRTELRDALRCAPEPATLVLDSVVGFYVPGQKGDKNMDAVRSFCVAMLEGLLELKAEIGAEVKERAKALAGEWREKVIVDDRNHLDASLFLHLVAAYGLRDEFKVEELIDFAIKVAKLRQGIKLCRATIVGDRISDVIVKLISEGKQIIALKFSCEFELTEKFPPAPLLKAYVKDCKKVYAQLRGAGKNSVQLQNNARYKEIMALKSAIKAIDDYKLECPKGFILKRIDILEKAKADKKGPAAATPAAHQQQSTPKNLSGNKRPRTPAGGPSTHPTAVSASNAGPAGALYGLATHPTAVSASYAGPAGALYLATHPTAVAGASSSVPAFEQSHLQPATYLSGPYGSAGMNPASASYAGPASALYGYAGQQPLGIHQNVQSQVYPPSLLHVPGGYVERPIASGGYGIPPLYHPPYYPQ